MPKGNESTTKFKADISELKSAMQEAARQVRLANSEFKAATSGMTNWGKSADGLSAKVKQLDSVLSAQKKQLASLEQQYKLTAEEQGENSRGAEELMIKINNQKAAIGKTEAQLKTYSDQLEEVEKASSEFSDDAEKNATASEKLKKKISEQENELAKLKSAYIDVALEQGESSDEAKHLAKEIEDLSSELKENKETLSDAEKAADGFDETLEDIGDAAEKSTGGFTVMKGALASLVADGIRVAIDALKDFVKETINVGKDFDSSMSEVQAISGATGEELQTLRDTAKEFGASTVFSASESADALKYMALAGWDTKQSVDALGGILDLAAASGMDLAKASDMVTDYLTAFGMEAKDSAYFADMLAYAQSNSNTTAEQLGEAYKNCAAALNASGQDVETTTALLAMMANQGFKGSEAGTALTAVMRDLTAKMKDGAIAIGDTQVQVMDANGNYRDMTDILKDVEAATQGMGDAERATALSSTFTADSIKGLNLMLNAGVDEAANFEEGLRGAGGTAKNMADTMNDNLNGDLKELSSQLEGIQISLYEKFEPALRKGTEALSKLLNGVDFVVKHSTEFVAAITAMGAGVAAYVAYTTAINIMKNGWMSLAIAQKAVTAAQWLMNAAMSANPIGIIIALIAGLVTAFVLLWKKSEAFRNFWIGLWDGIKSVTGTVVNAIVNFFTKTIPNAISSMLTFFQNLPGNIASFSKNALISIANWAANVASKALETGKNFLQNIVKFFKDLPYKIGYYIGFAIGKIVKFAIDAPAKAKELGQKFITNIVNFFKQLPGKVANFFTQTVTKATTFASNMGTKAKDAGSKFISNVVSFITQLPGKVANFLTQTISKTVSFVTNMGKKGADAAKTFASNIVNGLKSLPDKVVSIGSDVVKGIWNGISGAGKWIKDKVSNFAKGILDGMKNALDIHSPSRVFRDEVGKQIVAGVAEGIGKNTATAINSISRLAKDMLKKAKTAGKNGNYESVGKSIVTSMSKGIDSYSDKAINSVKKLVNKQVEELTKKNSKMKSTYSKMGKEVIEQYSKAMESATEKAKTALTKKLESISEATQKKYDEIKNLQDSMNQKLAEYGDLYSIDDSGKLVLKNIQTDINTLRTYGNNLEKLKGKISDDLMNEIANMQVEDAVAYSNALLNMSEQELKAYNDQYSQKVKLAASISKKFYADKLAEIKNDYTSKVTAAFADTKKQLEQAGKDAIEGFMKGMTKSAKKNDKTVTSIANSITKAMKKALKINSPSKVFEQLGIFSGQGYKIGFVDSLNDAKKSIISALPTDLKEKWNKGISGNGTNSNSGTRIVQNFYQTNNSPKALSRLEIYRQTKNQLAFAKGV